jgi:hypothetical protein
MSGSTDVPGFAFADLELRTFISLNRAGDSYHYVHPVDAEDRRVQDHLVSVGMLVCECAGGRFRGNCYQVAKAESRLREAGESAIRVAWIAGEISTNAAGDKLEALDATVPATPRGDDFEVMP